MSELTLLILQFAFLALLWIFVFVVVYAMRSDLFGRRVKKLPDGQPAAAGFPGAAPAAAVSTNTPAKQPLPQSKVPVFTPLEGSSAGTHPRATTGNATRLAITSGTKSGTEIPLGTMPLTIGRSTDSSVVIRDDYTSTHHARLMVWNEEWMLQDLDSTNGTFLDGKRVTSPVNVPLNTPIKIGASTFELRR
ncbi:FHA domain-containing protein [Agreia sp. COWG]|uniref:FHA domain-containing protein FhaB/FipA n=1 Tax=Agreia sp. COWG TaxID=2773266 RepID=UPI001928E8A9|nr:FHA domain-containing protein [Agreia sp. COWG]CAD5989187.1 FHA domain-containing protein [Agreia sp. COWG]